MFRLGNALDDSYLRHVRGTCVRLEARRNVPEVGRVERCGRVDRARQETGTQWAEWYEANTQFLADGEDAVLLRVARPERVFTLHGGDRLHRVGIIRDTSRILRFTIVAVATYATAVSAQTRAVVTVSESAAAPENLTSSRDGRVYFGSMATGTIYRALPGAARAEPWILASSAGLTRVLGLFADDNSNTLWVCQNATEGRGGVPAGEQTALRSFDLTTGAIKGTYAFPPNSRICNDIAASAD